MKDEIHYFVIKNMSIHNESLPQSQGTSVPLLQESNYREMMNERDILRAKMAELINENLSLKKYNKKEREERNEQKNAAEKEQVYKVVKKEIIPVCPYIGNRNEHMKVMSKLCDLMNVSLDDLYHFVFLYELDVLTQLSQHRNNVAQQMKKKFKGDLSLY